MSNPLNFRGLKECLWCISDEATPFRQLSILEIFAMPGSILNSQHDVIVFMKLTHNKAQPLMGISKVEYQIQLLTVPLECAKMKFAKSDMVFVPDVDFVLIPRGSAE